MTESKSATKDPICGMTVDKTTSILSQRDGKTSYFCSEGCRQKFLAISTGSKVEDKVGGCCG